jgi:hypothetical protein
VHVGEGDIRGQFMSALTSDSVCWIASMAAVLMPLVALSVAMRSLEYGESVGLLASLLLMWPFVAVLAVGVTGVATRRSRWAWLPLSISLASLSGFVAFAIAVVV